MKRIFTLIAFWFLGFYSNAQFVENFAYTSTGNIANDTLTNPSLGGVIWKKHSGSGGGISYNPTPLSYSGYSGSAVGGAINFAHIVSTSREDANAAIGTFNSGSVYASFLINFSAVPASTADYQVHFGGTTGSTVTGFFGRFFVKTGATSGTTYNLGIAKNSTSTISYSTSEFTLNTTYLVVIKYTFNTGSTTDDVCSMYVFSSGIPATEPSLADAVSTDATTDATSIASLCIRQGTGSTNAVGVLDGIRVSNGWYNSPLPLSLTSFNASLVNKEVSLVWNTANEINVDGFSIEKSNDGRTFNNIGFVAAKNASSANYSFNDVLAAGVNYYRLKITDKDGSFKYSSIVAVNAKQSTKLDIFPNPVVNTATLSHTKAGENATVKLITIDGKTVLNQNIQAGATQSSIDVSKLIKGNYLVVFENDGNRTSLQFVKQ